MGIDEILERVVERIPAPQGDPAAPLQALIIDSWFDNYVGVVMLVRVVNGTIKPKDKIRLMATGANHLVEQVGVFTPKSQTKSELSAGQVGFVVAGIKELKHARVGDTVTFKLTSQVPLTVGYLNTAEKPYYFSIGDTMSKGLTFQQVTSVTIGNKTLTRADDGATATADQYQLTTTANQKYDESDKDGKATVLKFDLSNAVYAAGQNASNSKADAKAEDTITVVYTAKLNKDAVHAVNGANPNKVTLDYTHNPDDNTVYHVPGPEVKVYTYDFGFLKVKADGQTSLDGAKFVIKQGDQYFRFNTTTGLWENGTKDADPVDADKFTGTNGVFEFKGLAEGTYDVVETDAPAGYLSTTKAKFQVVITSTNKDKDGNVLGTEHKIEFVNGNTGFNLLTNLNADGTAAEGGAKVKNLKSITQLPLTGAAGIAIFGVMAALVIGAGLAVGMKRRGIASRLA